MTKLYFPAIMETNGSSFGVYFPDVPGCVAVGESGTEAAINAADALALHLEGLVRDGHPIPSPSDLSVVEPDPPNSAAVKLLVTAAEPTISERVNVWLPKLLLQRVDEAAAETGASRSSFLARAARLALEQPTRRAVDASSAAAPYIAAQAKASGSSYSRKGNDTITGGAGEDTITGGAGEDTITDGDVLVGGDDSLVVDYDPSRGDWLEFTSVVYASLNFTELAASSYEVALANAQVELNRPDIDYVVVQVGDDTVVFSDKDDEATTVLVGKNFLEMKTVGRG